MNLHVKSSQLGNKYRKQTMRVATSPIKPPNHYSCAQSQILYQAVQINC